MKKLCFRRQWRNRSPEWLGIRQPTSLPIQPRILSTACPLFLLAHLPVNLSTWFPSIPYSKCSKLPAQNCTAPGYFLASPNGKAEKRNDGEALVGGREREKD